MNERSLSLHAVEIEVDARRVAFLAEACGGDAALRQRVERLLQAHARAGSFLDPPAQQGQCDVPTVDSAAVTEGRDRRIGPYKLLQQICQAVQYAHTKGIIHRDLKPSNVLVALCDGEPVPKVIDFGVAKATAPSPTEQALFTEWGQVVGTLEYMSPEQAGLNPLDVDTRSDVYSLGVLLYELLTGGPPFDRKRLRETALDESLRIIREEEPPRPSTRLSTTEELPAIAANRGLEQKRLKGLVRGELDWIVMKALEKERARRYETASALAADVERYRRDEPVLPSPPSPGYRLGKFGRRHRGWLASALLLALALVLGSVASAYQALRATAAERATREERDEAESARQQADTARDRGEKNYRLARQSVAEYLRLVTENPDLKNRGEFQALRQRLLETAIPFLEEFVRYRSDDPSIRGDQVTAYLRLGDIRGELGEALGYYQQACAVAERLVADFPDVAAPLQNLALGHYYVAAMLDRLGRHEAAEWACRRSLDIRSKLASDFPDQRHYRENLSDSYSLYSGIRKRQGKWSDAEAAERKALEIEKKLVDADPTNPSYASRLADSHVHLGKLLLALGKKDEAVQAAREGMHLSRKLLARHPDVLAYRTALAESLVEFGAVLIVTGRHGEARKVCEEVAGLQKQLVDDFPRIPQYRHGLATTYDADPALPGRGHLRPGVRRAGRGPTRRAARRPRRRPARPGQGRRPVPIRCLGRPPEARQVAGRAPRPRGLPQAPRRTALTPVPFHARAWLDEALHGEE